MWFMSVNRTCALRDWFFVCESLCWVPVIETEVVYVYFSPFCRGIILTFVLVGCIQREKL